MLIRATLITLMLILFIVVATSYYVNKEAFEDISNSKNITNEFSNAIKTNPTTIQSNTSNESSTIPKRTDVTPEVTISGSGYDAMSLQQRSELLKDIQKVVRNEILANRHTQPIISGETRELPTNSTAQGKEYENNCYKEHSCPKNPDGTCPPVPDMSQYIKKDAIPCWGCSLDY